LNGRLHAIIGGAAALCAAASLFCSSLAAMAQPVPRIKARVMSFDGKALRLDPLSSAGGAGGDAPPRLRMTPAPSSDGPFTVQVRADTRYAVTVPALLSDIKPGDYAGAAVREASGKLTAQEVFLYPPGLAGTGEGRFSEGERTMINGKVTAASASAITLAYRGAAQSAGVCMGRAGPSAIASPLSCTGTAAIAVPGGVPVMALSMGNAGMLAPGAMVTVSLARDPQGNYVTPGVVIQGAVNVENPPPSP
jgi:hypothetical protein